MSRSLSRALVTLCVFAGLSACGKPENPNDYPVSHWLKDNEDCVRATAAAIGKAGLPFPHYTYEEEPSPASGTQPKQRIKTVDMWLGPTRFVVPAQVAASNGFYPEHHPRRYEGLRGSLPQFYPPGPQAPEIDGMGSMVEVSFKCSMNPKYIAAWGQGYRSNAEGIEKVKARYEADATQFDANRPGPSKVSVNRRDDIGMVEVLYERGGAKYNDGMPMWEATYWPIDGELKGPSGNVSGIKCDTRHDPIGRRYGGQGWRCRSSMAVTPHASANVEIYVSHIQQMPAVFEQVKQLLLNAKQPSGE
jgi:hypothetical protein